MARTTRATIHYVYLVSKKTLSVAFLCLFLVTITAPTIALIVNKDFDASAFLSLSEEEEKKEKDQEPKKLLLVFEYYDIVNTIVFLQTIKTHDFGFTTYHSPHLNIISPPPEGLSTT